MKKYQDGTLTPEEAQRIILVSTTYDIPWLLNYSLAFALFKTYAIVRTTFTLHVRALMVALPAVDIKVIVRDWLIQVGRDGF